MEITIDIPLVDECAINECAYNTGQKCHAKAITIGDGVHPGCDTSFMDSSQHTNDTSILAGVGACKVTGCTFNNDLECSADSINVGMNGNRINCLTYTES